MKKFILLVITALMISPAAFTQKTVIGTVDYTYKIVGEGAQQMAGMMPEKMVIKYGKNGIAVEMHGGMMGAAMGKTVVNGKTGEAYIINDAQKTVYLMSEETIKTEAAKAEQATVEKFDDTREIMGYTCQKHVQTATVQSMTMTQVFWVAKDLKAPDYDGEAFKGMAGQGAMSFNIDGFPLLIEVDIPGMAAKLHLEVSNINFEDIPENTFERPEDYTVRDFTEMNRY
ncbi:MAG: DUF4412 domain-containing protein [Bacteroidales bacterium]|nr:DUF4412 domain-containing protein [Bacteroidales bacterium]MDT8431613.1 DUF4412 domain-containing protein [Bacteroidales bacterium]